MDDDDSSTILESSLFYSCMSSAPDEVSGGDVNENDKGAAGSVTKNVASNPIPVPSSGGERGGKGGTGQSTTDDHGAISQPIHHEHSMDANAMNNLPPGTINSNQHVSTTAGGKRSPASSNSSWSVLSTSEAERPIVRSITFNRDRTCLIVSTNRGVRIRTLNSAVSAAVDDHIDNHHNNCWTHDVQLLPDGATYAQLLHTTSLLAVIQPSSPRCCFLYNAKKRSPSAGPLATLPLSAAVKRVELQRRVLVALTVDLRLHVFHMTEGGGDVHNDVSPYEKRPIRPTLIATLNVYHPTDSPRNVTRGMDGFNAGTYFDLSPHENEPYLVCKSFNGTPGTIRVYDPTVVHTVNSNKSDSGASVGSGRSAMSSTSWDKYNSQLNVSSKKKARHQIHLLATIHAHENAVTRMLIGGGDNSGQKSEKQPRTFLATTSNKGTTIRVFGLPRGDHLWEWQRGSRACQFYSLSWNGTADRLASFGSSGTIHVFDWKKQKQPKQPAHCCDDNEDNKLFEAVDDEDGPRDVAAPTSDSKPLLRRIGSSIKRRANSTKNKAKDYEIIHRSMAKMKYKQSAGAITTNKYSQPLVLALLDRNQNGSEDEMGIREEREDSLVLCAMDCELRQYSIKVDKSIGLIRIEDVLSFQK